MGGDCWVLPDSRVEKLEQHSGQLGFFQLSQMSQECAELGTTSQLPSPPPPLTLHLLAGARPYPLPFLILFWGAWLPSDPLTTAQPTSLLQELSKARVIFSADPRGLADLVGIQAA